MFCIRILSQPIQSLAVNYVSTAFTTKCG